MSNVESSSSDPTNNVRPIRSPEIAGSLAFVLIAWFALVVAGLGIATVLFNRDIITDPRAGVGLGPAMVFGALVAFTITLAIGAFRRREFNRTAAPYVAISILAAVVSYLGYIVTALICWLFFVPGNPVDALGFAIAVSLDWPATVIALASLAMGATFFAYLPWRTRNVP
jgi:uncharacterized protein YacL